ncbi:MAG TPA: outer membrane protein assembly factor BamD, partial [bacterium]|nr:outer membrane protein assembly factor BamD [bacterium]
MAPRSTRFPLSTRCAWLLPGLALSTLLLTACSQNQDNVQFPAREMYLEAQVQEDQGLYSDAIEKFKKMVTQNPGTLLGSYGYLRLAELYFKQEDWVQAETNYRLFLSANSNGPLTPYVLYRLLVVNDKKSYTGLFFPARETDRDTDPDRQIL